MPASRLDRPLRELAGNDTARCVLPSRTQYPHQWLWNSCFHAIALAYLKPRSAIRELESLLESQWEDGRVPHISFNPALPQDKYRPNAEDWKTGRPSSGIVQPPLLATAAKVVFQMTGDAGFLERVYPKIAAFHRWLKETRDPHERGIIGVVHPWESGMDNSPVWDGLRDDFLKGRDVKGAPPPRVDTRAVPTSQRPTDDDYRFYWGLISRFQDLGWDGRAMAERSPMLVADVLFNSVWARANEDLSQIAWRIGRKGDSSEYRFYASNVRNAIREKLWNPEARFFYAYNMRRGEPIPVRTAAGFAPLFAQAAKGPMAAQLVEHLLDRRDFYYGIGVPSVSLNEKGFEPECYWRGPVWINVQWMIVQGLIRYGCFDIALAMAERAERLVAEQGYWEYYDPFTGKGLGAPHFSWSTLADTFAPYDPPEELNADAVVLDPEAVGKHPELRALYRHPEAFEEPLEAGAVLSTPRQIVDRILAKVERELGSARKMVKERGEEGLRRGAAALKGLIRSQHGLWKPYGRISDLACVAAAAFFDGTGMKARIFSNKYLHHYVVVGEGEGERILDLAGEQFASDPLARIMLLFETATLRCEEETALETPSWMRLEEVLLQTQYAVEDCLLDAGPDRVDSAGRRRLLTVLRRHGGVTERLVRLALPSSTPFLKNYGNWLHELMAPLTSQSNDPLGRRLRKGRRLG